MKRLFLFLRAKSWGSRLQLLVVALILGYQAWIDFQLGYWPVTIGIMVVTWIIGRLLLPLMMAYPQRAQQILRLYGIIVLLVFIFARHQWWWRTVAAHFGREIALWLDVSCEYWFVSELCLRQQALQQPSDVDSDESLSANHGDRSERSRDDWGDQSDGWARTQR